MTIFFKGALTNWFWGKKNHERSREMYTADILVYSVIRGAGRPLMGTALLYHMTKGRVNSKK